MHVDRLIAAHVDHLVLMPFVYLSTPSVLLISLQPRLPIAVPNTQHKRWRITTRQSDMTP
jgi:hypothetical protein